MRALSMDLRERVIQAFDAGKGNSVQLGERFGVSDRWVRKLLTQRRETGSIEPKAYKPGPKPKLTQNQRDRLCQLAADQPDLTLDELRRKLRLRCSIVTVWRALKQMGYTKKEVVPS